MEAYDQLLAPLRPIIFAEPGRTSGILSEQVCAALIIVIALSTLLSPMLLKGFYRSFLPT